MAKINIPFNGTDYLIDESTLTSATTELQSHLQTEMSGTGAKINLGGNSYNVDATKLTNTRSLLTSYLETISGSGSKVVVNGIEYSIDSTKTSGAVTALETTLNTLSGGSEPEVPDEPVVMRAAGLYETGTDTMVVSWDELVAEGAMMVNDGAVTVGTTGGGALPDINEYGFYYGAMYSMSMDGMTIGLVFNNDGSFLVYNDGVQNNAFPAGSAIYRDHAIDLNVLGCGICPISNDGTSITLNGMGQFNLSGTPGTPYIIVGDLVLPNDNSITIIPNDAFSEQSLLTGVVIPDSVTSVGDIAFYNCDSLTSVVIGNSVTSIGQSAFKNCGKLTSVIIGASVVSIGMEAFFGCDGLTEVNYLGSIDDWAQIDFNNATSANPLCYAGELKINGEVVTEVNLTTATAISKFAFYGCTSLTSVVIGDSVTSIGNSAFSVCNNLTSVIIPSSVTSIGEYAFFVCDSLTIYCEATSKPSGWNKNWNYDNRPVVWGYQG